MAPAKQARKLGPRAPRATFAALDLRPLTGALSPRDRELVRTGVRGLLSFQRSLKGWPTIGRVPDATPIVASYVRGVLAGCALERGSEPPGQRLARAFLASTSAIRDDIAAEVFFPRKVRWLDDISTLEIGTEGVALVRPDTGPVLLMARVARDLRVDSHGLLALLASKASLEVDLVTELPPGARLAAWTVDSVVARAGDTEARSAREAARAGARDTDYAAAWLARMIDTSGSVAFAIDPRGCVLQPEGELWHARSAIAIEALAAYGDRRGAGGEHAWSLARARAWLGRDIERGLRGDRVPQWPTERAGVAGTLALAALAGVRVHEPLRALVGDGRWRDLVGAPAWPWHAGQIACALGRDTPHDLWTWLVASLARQPFAPYVALAAKVRGDDAVYRRAASSVAAFIRRGEPHAGGATATAVPETALTAVGVQALSDSREHHAARERARAFVRARQLLPGAIPAPLDPALAIGGFAGSPIDDVQRADIAGHALLALLA